MNQRKSTKPKIATTLLSTLILAATFTAPAIYPAQAANQDNIKEQDSTSDLPQEIVKKADPYVSLTDSEFTIHPSIKDHLSENEVQQVENSVSEANKQIRTAKEKQSRTVTKNESAQEEPEFIESTTEEAVIFTQSSPKLENSDGDDITPHFQEGETSISYFWWGVRIRLSKTTLQYLGGGVAIGGVWVPEPLVSKILATLGIITSLSPGGIWADYTYAQLALFTAPGATTPIRTGFQ